VHSSPASDPLSILLTVEAAREGRVLFIDGWNVADVYAMARVAEGLGLGVEALKRIYVSRAFTAYQVLGLLKDLESHVERFRPVLVVLSEPLRLFLDDEFPRREGVNMLAAAVGMVKKVVDKGLSVAAFTALSPKMPRRRGAFVRAFEAASDTVVEASEAGGVIMLKWTRPQGKVLHLSSNHEGLDGFLIGD